ncbi:hypothetical protein GA0115242_1048145 [Streptomyces sp. SolWspMP-5a-2]|nr:hypothetical protein GA0115242_1048145 [Streptomyces sp. SolWspMP-5a-2]
MSRPSLGEGSPGQQAAHRAFTQGLVGPGRPDAHTTVIAPCANPLCATPAIGAAPAEGMVRVTGSRDGARTHWYCDGRCAAIGHARAELRAIPVRGKGPR